MTLALKKSSQGANPFRFFFLPRLIMTSHNFIKQYITTAILLQQTKTTSNNPFMQIVSFFLCITKMLQNKFLRKFNFKLSGKQSWKQREKNRLRRYKGIYKWMNKMNTKYYNWNNIHGTKKNFLTFNAQARRWIFEGQKSLQTKWNFKLSLNFSATVVWSKYLQAFLAIVKNYKQ